MTQDSNLTSREPQLVVIGDSLRYHGHDGIQRMISGAEPDITIPGGQTNDNSGKGFVWIAVEEQK